MLLYLTLGTDDIARARAFWAPLMADLGHPEVPDLGDGWAGWGGDYDTGFGLYLCPPFDGRAASPGNGTMLAFPARSAAHVRSLHALSLRHGGTDDGPPGTRPAYEPSFYVAYVRDPDGHKLGFVFHRHDPATDTT